MMFQGIQDLLGQVRACQVLLDQCSSISNPLIPHLFNIQKIFIQYLNHFDRGLHVDFFHIFLEYICDMGQNMTFAIRKCLFPPSSNAIPTNIKEKVVTMTFFHKILLQCTLINPKINLHHEIQNEYTQCFFRTSNTKRNSQFQFYIPVLQNLPIYTKQKEFLKSYEGNLK